MITKIDELLIKIKEKIKNAKTNDNIRMTIKDEIDRNDEIIDILINKIIADNRLKENHDRLNEIERKIKVYMENNKVSQVKEEIILLMQSHKEFLLKEDALMLKNYLDNKNETESRILDLFKDKKDMHLEVAKAHERLNKLEQKSTSENVVIKNKLDSINNKIENIDNMLQAGEKNTNEIYADINLIKKDLEEIRETKIFGLRIFKRNAK